MRLEKAPACGTPLIQERIVGGLDSKRGEWPWQVAIWYLGDQHDAGTVCGGTLIANSWVLLTAHCFQQSLNVSAYKVYFGVTRLSSINAAKVESRGLQRIIIHPNFTDAGYIGDIALIELNKTINYTSYILPMSLPSQKVHLPEGTMCWAIGWGNIEETVELPPPKILQKVQLAVIDSNNCEAMYQSVFSNFNMIKPDMFCAGYKGGQKDACQGDSGGPLMCKVNGTWLQFGIISWGIGCGEPDFPGVYTSVQYYQSWLLQYIPDLQFSDGGDALLQNGANPFNIASIFKSLKDQKTLNSTSEASKQKLETLRAGGTCSTWSMANAALILLSLIFSL
ncbi:serine protease 27-like [Hyperolius riggenbachi]|uniref:serine protease 27-like n=1 Tax=Hyperolius riggenbachi TaxID=752182 RepID=UPI0035A2FD7F